MSSAINKLVSKIRKAADKAKSTADEEADKALAALEKAKEPINVFIKLTQFYANAAGTTATLVSKVTEKGPINAQTKGFLKHLQVDAANRLNEFGNLVQALGQDEEFDKSATATETSLAEFMQAAQAYRDSKVYWPEVGDRVELVELADPSMSSDEKKPSIGSEGTAVFVKEVGKAFRMVRADIAWDDREGPCAVYIPDDKLVKTDSPVPAEHEKLIEELNAKGNEGETLSREDGESVGREISKKLKNGNFRTVNIGLGKKKSSN